LQDDAVDDGLDGVVLLLVETHALRQLDHFAIDARPEALLVKSLQLFAELAFATAHDGSEDGDALSWGLRDDLRHDLLRRLASDGQTAVGAVRLADRGIEQTEIVVDFGDGADRGTRAAGGRLLLDGDGRREAVDRVDVGTLHLVDELAG